MADNSSPFDATLSQGRVGLLVSGDGSYNSHRQGKSGELIVSEAHGRFYEGSSRGKMYLASIGVAGVAPGTALSTSPAFQIWNPVNSGILVAIKQVFVSYVSGTLGAGSFVHSVNLSQVTAPSGGTELTPVCALLNTSRGTARAFTGSTISATSTLIRASLNMGAALASTANFPALSMDPVEGGIVIPQGVAYCYQGIAVAGTSPLVIISALYEEITVPS